MAPEWAPALVVFDGRFEGDEIVGNLQYIEVPPGRRLRVRWEVAEKPEGFESISEGVVFVAQQEHLTIQPISSDAKPDQFSEKKFRWTEGLNMGIPWVMMVIILPENTSILNAYPRPARAKVFKENRIAAYWILKGDDHNRTSVVLDVKKDTSKINEEVFRINRNLTSKINRGENAKNIQVVDKENIGRSIPWWIIALICGILSILIYKILEFNPKWVDEGLIGISITIIVLMLNPQRRYYKAFWSSMTLLSSLALIPALDLAAKIETESLGKIEKTIFNLVIQDQHWVTYVVLGLIAIATLILDFLERKK